MIAVLGTLALESFHGKLVCSPIYAYMLFCRDVCVVDADWLYDAAPEYFKKKTENR